MDKLRLRDLQRWNFTDLDTVLPIAITHDSQTKWVLLGIADYNKLVTKYKSEQPVSHDSQGSQVADADGYPVYDD